MNDENSGINKEFTLKSFDQDLHLSNAFLKASIYLNAGEVIVILPFFIGALNNDKIYVSFILFSKMRRKPSPLMAVI